MESGQIVQFPFANIENDSVILSNSFHGSALAGMVPAAGAVFVRSGAISAGQGRGQGF